MSWYAIYTKSRAEKKLSEELNKKGIANYLPLKKVLRQWSDRQKWVEMPAINCYLFVDIEPSQIEIIYAQNHFVSFVRSFGQNAIIPSEQIDIMRRTLECDVESTFEPSGMVVGQKVKIITPPLEGVEGIVSKVNGKKKLYITIETTGLSLVLSLDKFEFETL